MNAVRGELDWLVMKALDKDRDRRYETASAFGLDVQRFLRDEPILAGPPRASYRLRKFAKRHKGSLVAAALILLALVGGIVGTTLGMIEAQQARDKETIQRESAEAERNRALKAQSEAKAILDFLQENVLDASRPATEFGGLGADVTSRARPWRRLNRALAGSSRTNRWSRHLFAPRLARTINVPATSRWRSSNSNTP